MKLSKLSQIIFVGVCAGSFGSFIYGDAILCPPSTDFNHNGKPDYVLYNGGTRQTAVWYMNNNVFAGAAYGPTLPAGWSVIDVADFNGNGTPDYALFNLSKRRTAIWNLSGVTFVGSAYGPTLPRAGRWLRPPILTATARPIMCFTKRARVKRECGT
jgi:hypothetical protein